MLTNLKISLLIGYVYFIFSVDGAVKHFFMRRGYWMDTDYLHLVILHMNQALINMPKSSYNYKCMVSVIDRIRKRISEFEAHNNKLAEKEG